MKDLTTLSPIIVGDGTLATGMYYFLQRFENPLITHDYFQNNDVATSALGNVKKLSEHYNEKGYDMFFTPNGQFARDGCMNRKAELGQSFDYLVFDTDQDPSGSKMAELINQISFFKGPDMPTYIVKTGGGYHSYYKLVNKLTTDTEKQMYKTLYGLLKIDFDIDTACSDISRWFRLPFSKYWKRQKTGKTKSDGSITTQLVHSKKENLLDFHKFFTTYEFQKKGEQQDKIMEKKLLAYAGTKGVSSDMSNVINSANAIDIETVLDSLGIRHKHGAIFDPRAETGGISDGWRIWKNKNCVTNFTKEREYRARGPGYWFVYKHFNKSFFDTKQFFKNSFNIQYKTCDQLLDINFDNNEDDVPELKKSLYILTEERIGELMIDVTSKRMLFSSGINNDSTPSKISDFYIKLLGRVQGKNEIQTLVQLISDVEESNSFFLPIESNITSFNNEIGKYGQFKVYRGGTNVLSLINRWIAGLIPHLPMIEMKNTLGFCSEGYVINSDEILGYDNVIKIIDAKKKIYEKTLVFLMAKDVETNALLGKKNAASSVGFNIKQDTSYSKEDFIRLIHEELPKMYAPSKILTLFLGTLGVISSATLKSNGRKGPHIIVWGETQAGKTSNMNMLKDVFGFRPNSNHNANVTPFPLIMSATTGGPVHLTEYREELKICDTVKQLMRDSFDGHNFTRGTAAQQINSYPMVSSFIIEGNHAVNDSACQSRSYVIHMTRKDIIRMGEDVYRKNLNRITSEHSGLLKWFLGEHLVWINNNFEKFDKQIINHKIALIKALGEKFVGDIEDAERTCEIYSYILAMYDRMTDGYKVEDVRQILIENILNFFKSYRLIDDISGFINCIFKLLLNIITSGQYEVIEQIQYDDDSGEITLMKILFDKFIRSDKEKEQFEHSLSSLTQMDVTDTDGFMVIIKTKCERLAKSKLVIKSIVDMIKKKKKIANKEVTFEILDF